MKKLGLTLAAAMVLALTGCILTSVHPFYTTKDIVYKPALVGTWTNTTEADQHWIFDRFGAQGYRLKFVTEGKTNTLQAQMFQLQGQMFLDLASLDADCENQPPPVPSHFLLKVVRLAPSVRLDTLNYDWVRGALSNNPSLLRHIVIAEKPDDDRLVLTANTQELQQFLIKNMENHDAWQAPFDLNRE